MDRRVRFLKITFTFLLIALGAAIPAVAQVPPRAPVFVADLTDERNRVVVVSAATFNEALKVSNTDPVDLPPLDRVLSACTPDGRIDLPDSVCTSDTKTPAETARCKVQKDKKELLQHVRDCVDCLKAHQETRFVTQRNDEVALIVLFDTAVKLRPFFQETPRESELLATAKAMAKLLGPKKESSPLQCQAFTYTLQRQRSFLKVTIPAAGKTAEGAGEPTGGVIETQAPPRPDVVSPEVTLGPIEHWFLSADFSISKSQVHLGKTPEVDADKLKNKDFFVGFNFSIGDLLADREHALQRRSFWKELLVKIQLTPTRQPWSAWAVGFGFRGARIKTVLWSFDVVHPYLTIVRQQGDETTTASWRAVVGLGFDPRSLKR